MLLEIWQQPIEVGVVFELAWEPMLMLEIAKIFHYAHNLTPIALEQQVIPLANIATHPIASNLASFDQILSDMLLSQYQTLNYPH